MAIIIAWIAYALLILLALLYASVIVWHIIKYRYDDLPRDRSGQSANRALALYLGFGGLVLLVSIVIALSMLLVG